VSETEAYDELVAARAPALLRLAVMLTGDRLEAEDLLQTTLARTQKHARRISAMAAPTAYLRRAMVHEHVSGLRRLRRSRRTLSLVVPDVAGVDEAGVVDRRDATWRLLATLPRQQRAVLVLRFYEDLPDADIAALMGCAPATVRTRIHRALATLRKEMTP